MATSRELGRLEDERGTIVVALLSPRVLLTTIKGHCGVEHAQVHVDAARSVYAPGRRLHHFFDVYELETYDSRARVLLTHFAIDSRAHLESALFLVRSKLVAMGVSTASLAARLAGITFESASTRAAFEARLNAAIQEQG